MKRVTFLAAACALGLFIVSQSVSAQYPPPIGSVSASASATTAAPGSTVSVSCSVVDKDGKAVSGAVCQFSTSGGSLSAGSATTGSDGTATVYLYVGTQEGSVVVSVSAGGLNSQVVIEVLSARPPAAPLDINPPATGDGGLL